MWGCNPGPGYVWGWGRGRGRRRRVDLAPNPVQQLLLLAWLLGQADELAGEFLDHSFEGVWGGPAGDLADPLVEGGETCCGRGGKAVETLLVLVVTLLDFLQDVVVPADSLQVDHVDFFGQFVEAPQHLLASSSSSADHTLSASSKTFSLIDGALVLRRSWCGRSLL